MTKDERRMFMKIKKSLFLSLVLIIGLFLFTPNSVNAADDSVYSLDIITEDFIVDEPFPSTVMYIFETSNEIKKFELNCFWLLAEGETQVPEGAVAENEVEYIPVADPGNLSEEEKYEYTELMNKVNPTTTKIYYNNELLDFTNGKMTIKARNKVAVTLDANGGTINSASQYIEENYTKMKELPVPIREGFVFKGWYTKAVGGMYLYLNDHISNGMTIYAHWDKKETATVDFVNFNEALEFNDIEGYWLKYILKKGQIVIDEDTGEAKNIEGKHLFTLDSDGKITLVDNLTTKDNIVYKLSNEEKKELEAEDLEAEGIEHIPDRIEVIFSTKQVVKVTFYANGGVFKNNITTIDIEDIINFDYDAFEKPTRKGYKFIGFYTKDGSKSYLDVNNSEAGFEEDTTFYAKWELDETVPQTFDGIGTSIFMGTISLIGLVGATIILEKEIK